jgi:hypothetical protein
LLLSAPGRIPALLHASAFQRLTSGMSYRSCVIPGVRIGDDEAMELVRENLIRLTWKEERICAMLGIQHHQGRAGYGATVPEALRDLAANIENQDITVWVRRPAKPLREDGMLKAACPECGEITEFTDFAEVIAFVCDECGAGVDVERAAEPET